MEIPVALNIAPLNAPHKELDYLPLADMDFQIKDLGVSENPLRIILSLQRQLYEWFRRNWTLGVQYAHVLSPRSPYFP